jgi:hypothetical protein
MKKRLPPSSGQKSQKIEEPDTSMFRVEKFKYEETFASIFRAEKPEDGRT